MFLLLIILIPLLRIGIDTNKGTHHYSACPLTYQLVMVVGYVLIAT